MEASVEQNKTFGYVGLKETGNKHVFCQRTDMMDLPFLFFPGGSDGKASAYNEGDLGSILGSGRSPGEGNGNLLQQCCLENPMDRGAW